MIWAKEPGVVALVLDDGALVGAGCCHSNVGASSSSSHDHAIFDQKAAVVVQNSVF